MKKFLLINIFVFILTQNLFAANTLEINWNMIAARAMNENPNIKNALLNLQNAELAYTRALGALLPEMSLSASMGESFNESNSKSLSYGASASISLFNGFSDINGIKQKKAELESAKAKYKRTISDIAYSLSNAYINLMWAYETFTLLEKIKNRRTENKEMIRLRYNSGNVDLGSLKRVEADLSMSELDLKKSQRYIETASAALLEILGETSVGIILQTKEQLLSEPKNIRRPDFLKLIETIPEYLSAFYDAQSSKYIYENSKSFWYPSVNLSASLSRSNGDWTFENMSSRTNASLNISYPLFRFSNFIDVKTAYNRFEIAQNNIKSVRSSLIANSVSNFNSLLDAYETINVRKNYLEASQIQAEISERKYINGLISYQDWYSIENDYINSQRQLLETRRSAALEEARWKNFVGTGF